MEEWVALSLISDPGYPIADLTTRRICIDGAQRKDTHSLLIILLD